MSDINVSMLDDIIIPDESEIVEPVEAVEETVETVETPEPEVTEPPVDTSLTDVDGEPIDAEGEESTPDNVYATLADVLKEDGFFEGASELNISNADELAAAFRSELKKNELSDLTEAQRMAVEGFRNGIPQAEIVKHAENTRQYDAITPEVLEGNVELQKAVYITDLVNKGISESRAEKMFQISEDTGELYYEASASLNTLKANENQKFQVRIEQEQAKRASQEEAANAQKKAIKKSIYDVDKFLGDVKITQNLKEKVHASMTDIVGHADNGTPLNALMKARQEDPLDFETKLYYLFELTDGFSNLKKFSKQADSKAAKKLESLIQNNTFIKDSNAPMYNQDPESYDPGSIVELI